MRWSKFIKKGSCDKAKNKEKNPTGRIEFFKGNTFFTFQ